MDLRGPIVELQNRSQLRVATRGKRRLLLGNVADRQPAQRRPAATHGNVLVLWLTIVAGQ